MKILDVIGILILVLLLALGIALILRFLFQRSTLRKIQANTPANGLSTIQQVTLGGIHQWISMEATDLSHPILLFLHGGPGMPIPYGVGFRNHHHRLASSFILVHWDQRGSGKTYDPRIPEDSLNINQFVSDTKELVEYLKNKFGKRKVFLAAHSWGTVIAMNYCSQYPEDIEAYFGLEQLVNSSKADALAYQWALDQCARNDLAKASETLRRIGQPPYQPQTWGEFRQVLRQSGGYIYRAQGVRSPGLFSMLFPVLVSPDYTFGDIFKFISGMRFSYKGSMISEINSVAFDTTPKTIQVPVVFFQGRHDQVLPACILEDFVQSLSAPAGKSVIYLETSAHLYSAADAAMVDQVIISTRNSVIQ